MFPTFMAALRARLLRSGWLTRLLPTRCSSQIQALRPLSARSRPRAPIIKAKAATVLKSSLSRTPFMAGRWRPFRRAIRKRCTRASCHCLKVSNMSILTIWRVPRLPSGQRRPRFWLNPFRVRAAFVLPQMRSCKACGHWPMNMVSC